MKRDRIGLLLLAAALAVFPLFGANAFIFDVVIRIMIYAVVVIGLNLLFGFTGQISLGHAGFIGLGAYASSILTAGFGWPPLLALAAGALGTGALSFVIARPILSLKGHHLAMATLGLGIIISIVIVNESRFTGGSDGMVVPPFEVFGWVVSSQRAWYAIFSVVLLIAVWGSLNLVDSPAGRALRAIHGSEIAARTVGIDVTSFKVRIFVLSAVMASVMGSLEAHYLEFISPDSAGFVRSIILMTMVVIGGMASVFGSLIGAAIIASLPQFLHAFKEWETAVFGIILVLCMIFMPNGLVPTVTGYLRRFRA